MFQSRPHTFHMEVGLQKFAKDCVEDAELVLQRRLGQVLIKKTILVKHGGTCL
jgi:hypothetical protein